jgi:regulator of ribonuclease activity A
VGVIIFGAIRDSTAVAKLNLGIKALGTTARRAMNKTHGQIGGIVGFGNAVFRPGDWVYADADAVVVSRTELDLSSAKSARH